MSAIPSRNWANKYVGLPFKERGRTADGADCWGLARLVLANEFGIDVPDLSDQYTDTDDRRELVRVVFDNPELSNWASVGEPQPGDVIILRIAGFPIHFGVVVDGDYFLHTQRHLNAHLSAFRSPLWAARIVDVLRHHSRIGE